MTLTNIAVTLVEYAIHFNEAQSPQERSIHRSVLDVITRFLEESGAKIDLKYSDDITDSKKIETVEFNATDENWKFPTLNVHPKIRNMWRYGYIGTPHISDIAMLPISWTTAMILLDHKVTVYGLTDNDTATFVNSHDDIEYFRDHGFMIGVHFATVQYLWEEFGDVPMDPETERIEYKWLIFPAGTHREEIWLWFEEAFPISVAEDLMNAD